MSQVYTQAKKRKNEKNHHIRLAVEQQSKSLLYTIDTNGTKVR